MSGQPTGAARGESGVTLARIAAPPFACGTPWRTAGPVRPVATQTVTGAVAQKVSDTGSSLRLPDVVAAIGRRRATVSAARRPALRDLPTSC